MKVLIDKDQPLTRGDHIEMHFISSGMASIKAVQIALLEQRMANREDFVILNFQTPVESPTLLIVTVEVLGGSRPAGETPGATGSWIEGGQAEAPLQTASIGVGITVATIAASVIAANIMFYLTFKWAYRLVREDVKAAFESPIGKVAAAGTGIGIAAAGIAALILIFLPKK